MNRKLEKKVLNDVDHCNTSSFFSSQVPKEKRLLPVSKVVEITEEQEKRSVNVGLSVS